MNSAHFGRFDFRNFTSMQCNAIPVHATQSIPFSSALLSSIQVIPIQTNQNQSDSFQFKSSQPIQFQYFPFDAIQFIPIQSMSITSAQDRMDSSYSQAIPKSSESIYSESVASFPTRTHNCIPTTIPILM